MYICYYILSDQDKRHSTQFSNCGCVEGDKTELLRQIKSDKNFCRAAIGIGHDFFVESLKLNTFIYIKNESDNKILGACSIYLERLIIIYGICVPDNGIKGIGTLLLDKVKCIGCGTCVALAPKSFKMDGEIAPGFAGRNRRACLYIYLTFARLVFWPSRFRDAKSALWVFRIGIESLGSSPKVVGGFAARVE